MGQGLQRKECHNYILHPGLKFSDDLDSAQYDLQKLDKGRKVSWEAENELRGKFFLPPNRFKIRSLMSYTYNYAFYNLIRTLRSGSYPAPCDKKGRSEHQTLFSACTRGSGHETKPRQQSG